MSFSPQLFTWRCEASCLHVPQFCLSGEETFAICHTVWRTPSLNKFHCLLPQPLLECFCALMEKITQWLRSIPIPIYGFHIHWALTTAWQTFRVSLVTLSPSPTLAISNILPLLTPPTKSPDVVLYTRLFFLFRERERAFRSSLWLSCPSSQAWPATPSVLEPRCLTFSENLPSPHCFCNILLCLQLLPTSTNPPKTYPC